MFINYRKAKKDEGKCPECKNVIFEWWGKKPRCGDFSFSQAVGKTMTCDGFEKATIKKLNKRQP